MQSQHYAVIGVVLGAIAAQIIGLPNWHVALQPAFVGGTLGVVAAVLKAMTMAPPAPKETK